MSDKVEDQFSILLNSLNSSLLQKELPKDAIDESLHVWQPVPFASKEIEVTKTILKELPSIGTQTFTDVAESVMPTEVSVPANPLTLTSPSIISPPVTAPITALTTPVTAITPALPSPALPLQPLPTLPPLPEYMYPNPYMYPPSHAHSHAPSYPISYAPPSYAPSYAPSYVPSYPREEFQPEQNEEVKQNEKKFYLWALYIFGFSLILLIVFGLLWYFYIKDYNKYQLTKVNDTGDNKIEDLDDKPTLLQPPSTLHKELELEESKQIKEFNAFEFEKLIKDDDEDEEYFEEDKVFESLNALESLTFEKPSEAIPIKVIDKIPEKKEKLKKNYFDLSDMDCTDFISPPPLEKKMNSGGKLTDESPEVNDYAKKRELALQ